MGKFVYNLNEGNKDMKEILGGKGANLAEMISIGLPIPQGFTISTEACDFYYKNGKKLSEEIKNQINEKLAELEKGMNKKLGDNENPLLVSVRSGAAASMPGMMDTVLNLGLNDTSVVALAKRTNNERFAYDSYRRFIQMFGNVVMGVEHVYFEEILDEIKNRKNIKLGICGEHGGEPSSIEFCYKIGLNYVSCSPFRVPIARLAAAQAVIREKK